MKRATGFLIILFLFTVCFTGKQTTEGSFKKNVQSVFNEADWVMKQEPVWRFPKMWSAHFGNPRQSISLVVDHIKVLE